MEKEPGEQRAFKRHDAASFSLQPLYCYTPFQKSVLCRKSNKHFGYILSRFLDFWYEISTKIHVRFDKLEVCQKLLFGQKLELKDSVCAKLQPCLDWKG